MAWRLPQCCAGRVRLRTLMLGVLSIVLALGILTGVPRYQRDREAQLVSSLVSRGAKISYSSEPFIGASIFRSLGGAHFYDRVSRVTFERGRIDVQDCERLARLQHLQVVRLVGCKIHGAHLRALASSPSLKVLDLSHTRVTDDDIMQLAPLDTLNWIGLTGTDVTRDGLFGLERANGCNTLVEQWSFERLRRRNRMLDYGVDRDGRLGSVTFRSRVSAEDMQDVLHNRRVTSLSFYEVPDVGRHFASLTEVSRLTAIEVTAHNDDWSATLDASPLTKLSWLKSLCVQGCVIDDEAARHIGQLGQLEQLNVTTGDGLTDTGWAALCQLERLTVLNVGQCAVSDEGLRHVENLENLRSLWIRSPKLTDASIPSLTRLSNLRTLYLGGAFTADGVVQLNQLSNLQSLMFPDLLLTDNHIMAFRQLRSLQNLNFDPARLTPNGVAEFHRSRPTRCHLPMLNLKGF